MSPAKQSAETIGSKRLSDKKEEKAAKERRSDKDDTSGKKGTAPSLGKS